MDTDKKLNIFLICNKLTGKTSFLNLILNNTFSDVYDPTICLDIQEFLFDKSINIMFWDTSGEDLYKFIIARYVDKMDIILLFFDLEDTKSYIYLSSYIDTYKNLNKKIYIIGNKLCSLNKEISDTEAFYFAYERGIRIFFVDCKNNIGVTSTFNEILGSYLKKDNIIPENKSLMKKIYSKFSSMGNLKKK